MAPLRRDFSADRTLGHQALLMQYRILHRDVSNGNILTNPKHNAGVVDYEPKTGVIPYVPIDAILQGIKEYVAEFFLVRFDKTILMNCQL